MKIEQNKWTQNGGWDSKSSRDLSNSAQLLILFGGTGVLKDGKALEEIKQIYPNAKAFGCSTAGEIFSTQVSDNSLIATALQFEGTTFKGTQVNIEDCKNSYESGEQIIKQLVSNGQQLAHVFVLSDGIKVNGSELVRGIIKHAPKGVHVTGGLSGDGARFQQTVTFFDNPPREGQIVALGFYGDKLKIGCGSLGGWDTFGPERYITKSKGNVLFELDGKPALSLYKKYLGEHASGLPSTGLLFPLNVRTETENHRYVRTILAVSEADQSMTFAGDVPEGGYAQLMKANFDRLVDGAHGAAKTSFETIGSESPELAILISCVGRKLVLKQRTEEEVEAVRSVLGEKTAMTGFYSYGEICPAAPNADCELHNQTMTITTFSEK